MIAPMRREIRLLGTTVALRHIVLRAPAAGRVLAFNLQNGDAVRPGEVVAHIVNREVEAVESGLAVAKEIDPAESVSLARAARRYRDGAGIPVAATQDAIVDQRFVSSGQMVADLDPLADLIDPRSMYVEAAVPIGDLALILPGMNASVSSPILPEAELPARVAAISPNFSPGSATAPVRIEFTGARIEQAGAPVEVRVTTQSVPNSLVVPDAALFEDAANGTRFVFVLGTDARAHRTPVVVGIRSANRVQVISGLTQGQIVLTSGGYALSDGLRINVTVSEN